MDLDTQSRVLSPVRVGTAAWVARILSFSRVLDEMSGEQCRMCTLKNLILFPPLAIVPMKKECRMDKVKCVDNCAITR